MRKHGYMAILMVMLLGAGICTGALAEEGTLTLPSGLQIIDGEAFAGTDLDVVELPGGLQRIEEGAFADSHIGHLNGLTENIGYLDIDAFEDSQVDHLALPDQVHLGSQLHTWAVGNGSRGYGYLPPVSLVNTGSLQAGKDFDITFPAVPGADWYDVYLQNRDGDQYYLNAEGPGNSSMYTVHVSGAYVLPGTLHVEITACGYYSAYSIDYYNEITTLCDYTVTGSMPAAPQVTVTGITGDVASLGDTYTLEVTWASNATELQIDQNLLSGFGGEGGSGQTSIEGQSSYTITNTQDHVGINTYRFAVLVGGIWSEPTEVVIYYMDRGEESGDPPETIAQMPSLRAADTLRAGEDLTVAFDKVDGAVNYQLYMDLQEGQRTLDNFEYDGDLRQMTIAGYDMEPGEFTIRLVATDKSGTKHTVSQACKVEGTKPEGPDILSSVTGTYDEDGTLAVTVSRGQAHTLSVDTGSATDMLLLMGSEQWEDFFAFVLTDGQWVAVEEPWVNITWSTSGSTFIVNGLTEGPNQYLYAFSLKEDGVWSEYSTAVVTVQ